MESEASQSRSGRAVPPPPPLLRGPMVDSVSDENQGATRLSMSQGMMAGSNIDGGGSTRRDNNNNHLTLPVGAHARSRSVSRDVDVNEELQSSNTMPDYWNSRNSPSIIRHQSQPQPGLASLDIEFGRLRVHSNDFGEAFSATQNQAQHSKSEEAVNFMASRGLSSQKPIVRKVLSLDGGGVRGLSTIFILKSLMYSLETRRGIRVEPWQEFDLIGGTSTGGLLAIMLGRLRMSLDECEEAYLNLSRMIFAPVHHKANATGRLVNFVEAKGKFKHKPLEQCIKDILGRKGLPEDQLLREDDESACKSFVCAVTGYEHTKVLRSYKKGSYDSLLGICKIWEAARATSAASTLFEPITIGPYNEKFVDGALRHNNPINLAYVESSQLWPSAELCIVSIGTGSPPSHALTGNLADLVNTLKRMATDTEEKNRIFREQHRGMVEANRLFRFNVQGLGDVGLQEYEAIDRISGDTHHYLEDFDTSREIEKCVNALNEGVQRLGIAMKKETSDECNMTRWLNTCMGWCYKCNSSN